MKMAFAGDSGDARAFAPKSGLAPVAAAVANERANPLPALLTLMGLIIPAAEVQVFLFGAKFTVGRIEIFLLLIPAVAKLMGKDRRLLNADLLMLLTACWMVGAAINVAGAAALPSAGAEAIELLGGYVVARAYFYGAAALRSFLAVLKAMTFIAVLFAVADRMSNHLFIHDLCASFTHVAPIDAQFRMGVLRATSSFDHAIMFGLFCAVAAAMLLFSAASALSGFAYAGLCLLGGYLSLSSSSLMAFGILAFAFTYDTVMKAFSWRWPLFWAIVGSAALIIALATQHPLGCDSVAPDARPQLFVFQTDGVGRGDQLYFAGALDRIRIQGIRVRRIVFGRQTCGWPALYGSACRWSSFFSSQT